MANAGLYNSFLGVGPVWSALSSWTAIANGTLLACLRLCSWPIRCVHTEVVNLADPDCARCHRDLASYDEALSFTHKIGSAMLRSLRRRPTTNTLESSCEFLKEKRVLSRETCRKPPIGSSRQAVVLVVGRMSVDYSTLPPFLPYGTNLFRDQNLLKHPSDSKGGEQLLRTVLPVRSVTMPFIIPAGDCARAKPNDENRRIGSQTQKNERSGKPPSRVSRISTRSEKSMRLVSDFVSTQACLEYRINTKRVLTTCIAEARLPE